VVVAAGRPHAQPAPASPAACDVRYVANAGVLFRSSGAAFLFDAPIREGIEPYAKPDTAERRRLEGAQPPYDSVAAILVTHWHEDHLGAEAVAAHLTSNPSTVLVSSAEVVERVRRAWPQAPASRLRGLTPAPGTALSIDIQGVRVHVLRLRHNPTRRLPAEHVGFLVDGCRTVLHAGDADPQADNFAGLRHLPAVDAGVLPFWFVTSPANRQMVQAAIQPHHVLAAHLPPADAGLVASQLAGLDWVTLLREPGQTVALDRGR
jgi:L-ascorbate metabolism protein UlaG (beta-lactamase superfamily)